MAAYTGTPTVVASYELGDRYGKRQAVVRRLTLAISSQGGATNTIGYAALGFASAGIYKVNVCNYTDGAAQNRGINAWTDTNNILLGDPQVATDADRSEPLDMTGDITIEVTGRPA